MLLEHPSRERIRIDTRLPDELSENAVSVEQTFTLLQGHDNPLYANVFQEDGHAAWSSPIYLVPG